MMYLFLVVGLTVFLPTQHVAGQDFPPIPLSNCESRGPVRPVHTVTGGRICEGDIIEYDVPPNPSDTLTAEFVVYTPDERILGATASIYVRDFEFNELGLDDVGTKGQRDLGRVTVNSQQNQCNVPVKVELDGQVGCCFYDLTVTLQERIGFNMVGTTFDDATPLAESGVSNFCGSLNEILISDCGTGPVWSFNAKKKDKLVVNSLMEGGDFGVNVDLILYDEMETEVDAWFDGGGRRTNVKTKFSIPRDGKYYLRLEAINGFLVSYAMAIELVSSSSSSPEGACEDTKEKFYIKKGKCKSLKKLLKKKPKDARELCEDENSGAATACPLTCSMCPSPEV